MAALALGLVAVLAGTCFSSAAAASGKTRSGSKAPIEIGFDLTGNAGTNESQVVGASTTYTSGKAYDAALVKWVNSHGGLGGRPIQPVYYNENFNSTTNFDSLCTTYFQNNHIFADIPFSQDPSEFPCFYRNKAVFLGAEGTTSTFKQYSPSLWAPAGMPLDVYLKNYAVDVVKSGWIKKGAKVGLLYASDPGVSGPVQQTIIPYLKSHGVKLTDIATSAAILSTPSFEAAQIPTKNAVLRFKADGITQVLIPDWGQQYNMLLWLRDAEPQDYYPAFAFGNNVVAGGQVKNVAFLSSFGTSWYDGSMLVSSSSSTDVTEPTYPVTLTCHKMYAAEGISVPTQVNQSVDSSLSKAFGDCANVLFLKQVMAKGNVDSPASFKKAADALGNKIDAEETGSPDISLSSSRPYAGGHEVQDLTYKPSCTCFEVTRAFHPVLGY